LDIFDAGVRHLTLKAEHLAQSTLVVTDLNPDFAFLGWFDLVVCTSTVCSFTDPARTLKRLAERVASGGCVLFDVTIQMFAGLKEVWMEAMFKRVGIVPHHALGIPPPLDGCRDMGL